MFFSKLGLFTHFSHLSTQVKGKPATPTVHTAGYYLHTGTHYLPVIYLLGRAAFSIYGRRYD